MKKLVRALATYRKAYGLTACTTANGCFKQVNESGASSPLPSSDYGWTEEESLDRDAVSAACPSCQILLVEASSADNLDLAKAENAAAAAPGVAARLLQPSGRRHHRHRAIRATGSSTRRRRPT